MDVSEKVFRFPDGKGGNYYKIQGKDGQWRDCDETGRLLEKEVVEEEKPSSQPRARDREKPVRNQASVNMCVSVPLEVADTIEDYLGWLHRKNRRAASRSSLMVRAVSAYIRKDAEYQKQKTEP